MLSGAILNAAMMHGRPPADDVITAAVDIVLDASPLRGKRCSEAASFCSYSFRPRCIRSSTTASENSSPP